MLNTTSHASARPSRWNAAPLFRVLACLALATAAMAPLTGCETTEGAGRDLEKLGDNIEDAAQDAK